MHEAGPIPVRAGPEWYGRDVRASVEQNIRRDHGKPVVFLIEGAGIFDEDSDVVIRIRTVIATSTGTEQHDPFGAIAVQFIDGGTEAAEDRIIGRPSASSSSSHSHAIENHARTRSETITSPMACGTR